MLSSIMRMQKRGYNEVMLLSKENPIFDPSREVSETNPKLMPLTDCESNNYKMHKAFQQIYIKWEVDDSSEANQKYSILT